MMAGGQIEMVERDKVLKCEGGVKRRLQGASRLRAWRRTLAISRTRACDTECSRTGTCHTATHLVGFQWLNISTVRRPPNPAANQIPGRYCRLFIGCPQILTYAAFIQTLRNNYLFPSLLIRAVQGMSTSAAHMNLRSLPAQR